MKTYGILRKLIKITGIQRVILVFAAYFFISALVIMLMEPHIKNYGDACWYCFAVISTCGFGDVVVYSAAARVMSAILSIFSIVIIAMVTGVIVNLYLKVIERRMRGTLAEMTDKLEHLSELSKEELEEISERVKKFL